MFTTPPSTVVENPELLRHSGVVIYREMNTMHERPKPYDDIYSTDSFQRGNTFRPFELPEAPEATTIEDRIRHAIDTNYFT